MIYKLKSKFLNFQNKFRPEAYILMYHRITDLEIDPWGLAVSAKKFDEQLAVLKKKFNVIGLEELIYKKNNNELEQNSVVITFDDGYRDNYTTAYPILKKHKLPATFFISSAYIENQNEFWPDKLIRLLLNKYDLPKKELDIKSIGKSWNINSQTFTRKMRFDFFMEVWYSLLQIDANAREEALIKIEAWAEHDSDIKLDTLPMNKDELVDLAKQPLISIGGHTSNHVALSFLDVNSQRQEIESNKLWLENVLGKPISGFAYPNGSYNSNTISLMKEVGYDYACTTKEMRNSNYISNYELPRYQVYNWSKESFLNNLRQW